MRVAHTTCNRLRIFYGMPRIWATRLVTLHTYPRSNHITQSKSNNRRTIISWLKRLMNIFKDRNVPLRTKQVEWGFHRFSSQASTLKAWAKSSNNSRPSLHLATSTYKAIWQTWLACSLPELASSRMQATVISLKTSRCQATNFRVLSRPTCSRLKYCRQQIGWQKIRDRPRQSW